MKKQQQKPVSALKLTLQASEDKSSQQPLTPQKVPEGITIQSEEDFQKQHRQYMQAKLAFKKELELKKRQEFGASSSEDDDIGASESNSDEEKRMSTLAEELKFRESQKMKRVPSKQLQCSIYFAIKKGKQLWKQQTLCFDQQGLIISEKPIFLKQIHKIKIIQGAAIADCQRIKLSCIDESEVFVAANSKPFRDLPLNYFIFAFVIQQKLMNMDKKLFKCQSASLPGIPEGLVKNSYYYGKICKKSSILGRWQQRLVVVNKDGIYGYKKFNEKHSIFIQAQSVKQIWTRFEVQDSLLVIKILHNSSKTEFGVPLTEMLDKRCWLYSFYRLAFP